MGVSIYRSLAFLSLSTLGFLLLADEHLATPTPKIAQRELTSTSTDWERQNFAVQALHKMKITCDGLDNSFDGFINALTNRGVSNETQRKELLKTLDRLKAKMSPHVYRYVKRKIRRAFSPKKVARKLRKLRKQYPKLLDRRAKRALVHAVKGRGLDSEKGLEHAREALGQLRAKGKIRERLANYIERKLNSSWVGPNQIPTSIQFQTHTETDSENAEGEPPSNTGEETSKCHYEVKCPIAVSPAGTCQMGEDIDKLSYRTSECSESVSVVATVTWMEDGASKIAKVKDHQRDGEWHDI